MNRRSSRHSSLPAALAALVLGALAGFAPHLASHDSAGDGDRGDPPVVGSLPCIVDPHLDDLFGIPLGRPSAGPLPILPPILGLVGANLDTAILGADGDPFGMVNRESGWTIFGLHLDGEVILDRAQVMAGLVGMWEWLPAGYIGGTISTSAQWGNFSHRITGSSLSLPLAAFALRGGLFAQADVTIVGPANGPAPRNIRVTLTPSHVIIQHQI